MTKLLTALLATGVTAFAVQAAMAAGTPRAQITRPAGYKPMAGEAVLGETLFNDTKLSTNGMSCASCHADHGAFQASFAKPYPHTVAMAREQLGRKTVHLDEMIQGCMVMPMAAKPLSSAMTWLGSLSHFLPPETAPLATSSALSPTVLNSRGISLMDGARVSDGNARKPVSSGLLACSGDRPAFGSSSRSCLE